MQGLKMFNAGTFAAVKGGALAAANDILRVVVDDVGRAGFTIVKDTIAITTREFPRCVDEKIVTGLILGRFETQVAGLALEIAAAVVVLRVHMITQGFSGGEFLLALIAAEAQSIVHHSQMNSQVIDILERFHAPFLGAVK